MTTPVGRPPGRKTYTRLATGRRVPPEYELVSTDLHYNHPMRFELPAANPVVAWYYRYREGSALQAREWQQFSDPRRTTYRGYTQLQDGREDVVDGLLREIDDTGYDRDLDGEWVRFLDRWYSPLRFPVHGLQMLAAYVAQMAPASRITNCAAFQSADELRRVPATARTGRTGPGRLRLGRGVHGDQPCHQAPHRPAHEPGDRRHTRHSERRPDPDQHPLLARRGRTLASRVDHSAAAAPHRRHPRERRGGLRLDREVEPARFPRLGSPRRDRRRGACAARCERSGHPDHR